MQTAEIKFDYNTRVVYTAVRHLFEMKRTKFSCVKYNDDLFVVEARHGRLLSPFSENNTYTQICMIWKYARIHMEW